MDHKKKWGLMEALRILFALLITFLICQIELHFFDAVFFDLRTQFRPSPPTSDLIRMVIFDNQTVEKLKSLPQATDHEAVFKNIFESEPTQVLVVTDLTKIPGSDLDKKRLATTLAGFPKLSVALNSLEMKDDASSRLKIAEPYSSLNLVSAPKTSDSKLFAKDGVTRRALISYQGQPVFHPLLALGYSPKLKKLDEIQGLFDVYDSKQIHIDWHKPNSFKVIKFEDLNKPSSDLKNKIILVGDDLGLSHDEYVFTPYLRSDNSTTITELHAQIFETLYRNSSPKQVPTWVDYLITALISILTVHVVLALKPLRGILILLGTALGFTLIAHLSFWLLKVNISMSHPYLAIFLCYYFFIPYRLIIENRRSWEYFQKHKLLSEVEELKTNFIGMMSHDLKTPLARIQGMTDIIAKDSNTLSSPQREALDLIQQSSEDLTKFISTILNYAKIESEGVELHLQTKDINQLIREVVKKNEFLAQVKHIDLICELEPLFPIQVDPELIKQVLSNLIENAIKYSPENSKVLISSEEKDGQIQIQIADQGMGIPPDEIENIFMKFFRSKSAKTSPIRGSGLGLYLAKYFIGLHGGNLSVESQVEQGSTFTVELPLQTSKS